MATKKTTKKVAKKALEGKVLSKEQSMKKLLDNDEKVEFFIPDKELKKGELVPVIINGCRTDVPVGEYVMIPRRVANVLKKSQQNTSKAMDAAKKSANEII